MNMSLQKSTNKKIPLFSICIPVYDEVENLELLYSRLSDLSRRMSDKCNFEFIFTDNNSSDGTWEKLKSLQKLDQRIRAVKFSRNLGFQNSILYNYSLSQGEVIAQLDADMQDPPELLEVFFDIWRTGFLVVSGVREARKETPTLKFFRHIGYWAINLLSEHPIARNVGDFRLLDRKVVDIIKVVRTSNPYLRGIISGLGFPEAFVPYSREIRKFGKSKFGLSELLRLGGNAIFNHSNIQIRIFKFVGLSSLGFSIIGILYYFIIRVSQPDIPRGFISLAILILFSLSMNVLLLSVLASYIRKIYKILSQEPTFPILESFGIDVRN